VTTDRRRQQPPEHRANDDSVRWAGTVLLVALVAWAAVLGWIARGRLDGDVRGFIHAGLRYYHAAAFDDVPLFGPRGYDGEFYAALATDPLLLRNDTTWGLDAPGYRARRIGVPLLAWVAGLGRPVDAIYAYVVICWLGAVAIVPLLALRLHRTGTSEWWSLLALGAAGLVASVVRATPDGVAAMLILATLLAWQRGRVGVSLGLATVAVAVRETSLIACVALAVAAWRAHRRGTAIAFLAVPALVVGPWFVRLWLEFGSQVLGGAQNIGVPFSWLPEKLAQLRGVPLSNPEWVGTVAIATSAVALAAALGPKMTATAWTLAGFCALALLLGWKVVVDVWAYARVLVVIPVLAVAAAGETGRWRRRLLLVVAATWAVTGVLLLMPDVRAAAGAVVPARIAVGYGVKGATTVHGAAAVTAPDAGNGRVTYAFPIAHDRGGSNAWRTDLSIANDAAQEASIVFEVLKSSDLDYPWPCRLRIVPSGTVTLDDALERLFAWQGRVAFRITVERGSPTIRFRTYDVRQPDAGSWSRPLPAPSGSHESGGPGAGNGAPSAGTSGIEVVNASPRTCVVSLLIDPGNDRCRPLGQATLLPWRFAAFDEPLGPQRRAPGPFAVGSTCPDVLVALVAVGPQGGLNFTHPEVTTAGCSGARGAVR
jgi:hypothetical protein